MTRTEEKFLEEFLTLRLYEAAKKAGCYAELARAEVEVCVSEKRASLIYEAELHECEDFVFPREAFKRAEVWLSKAAKKHGLVTFKTYAEMTVEEKARVDASEDAREHKKSFFA